MSRRSFGQLARVVPSAFTARLIFAVLMLALGADVQCPGAAEAQRTSLGSLQAEIDELESIHGLDPNADFRDCGDGTVADPQTLLQWE